MQFAEELPDREAADTVGGRFDWKYALGLALQTVTLMLRPCVSRKRLVQGGAELLLLDTSLTLFKGRGWWNRAGSSANRFHACARQHSSHQPPHVYWGNHAFCPSSLAVITPDWLVAYCDETWLDRYTHRFEEVHLPKGQPKRVAFAEQSDQDGADVLTDLLAPPAPEWLRQVPAVERLRQVWIQNSLYEHGLLQWRSNDSIPPASRFIGSPHDTEARNGKKCEITRVGYKFHVMETCDEESPHLITHVATSIVDGQYEMTVYVHYSCRYRGNSHASLNSVSENAETKLEHRKEI